MATTADQIAALPLRWRKNGRVEILMVTSRESGRWVLPKGWTMSGTEPWRAAQIEAEEEAGATGSIARAAIGSYRYTKSMDDGSMVRCRVQVFPMLVDTLQRNWKERQERTRRWFAVPDAADAVEEASLEKILKTLSDKPRKLPAIRELLQAS